MAKYGRAKKYTEEDGYWFSTENGSHIHVEEGQTPREAVNERFDNAKSYNGARARKPENPNFNEKEFGEFFDENWQLIKGKEDEYFEKVNRLNKETYDKNYNQAKEINNYEKVKNIYDKQVEEKGEDSPEARGTKRALDEFKENFDKGNNKEFKLDKKKYPDVEETRYGFIYNVNGVPIEDIREHMKRTGMEVDDKSKYGFTIADEDIYFDTFEDAYNYAKRKNNEEDDDYFDIDGYHATGRKENKEKLQGYVDRAREQERRNNEEDTYVEYDDGSIRYGDEYYIDRNDLEEIAGPGALNHIREATDEERENKKKEYKRQEAEEQRNNLKKDVQRLIKDYGFTLDELVEFLKK